MFFRVSWNQVFCLICFFSFVSKLRKKRAKTIGNSSDDKVVRVNGCGSGAFLRSPASLITGRAWDTQNGFGRRVERARDCAHVAWILRALFQPRLLFSGSRSIRNWVNHHNARPLTIVFMVMVFGAESTRAKRFGTSALRIHSSTHITLLQKKNILGRKKPLNVLFHPSHRKKTKRVIGKLHLTNFDVMNLFELGQANRRETQLYKL